MIEGPEALCEGVSALKDINRNHIAEFRYESHLCADLHASLNPIITITVYLRWVD